MDEERKDYLKQYKKENLKRIVLDVKTDVYERVKIAAQADNKSVSRYIKGLIEEDLKEKEDNSIAYKIVKLRISNGGSPLDYYKSMPQAKPEKIIFPATNANGGNAGISVALVSPEEAEKYREAKKAQANN